MTNRGKIIGGGLAACMTLAAPCVMYFEGLVPHTYTDIVGIPTDCYGHTGSDVKPGQTFTKSQCQVILQKDLDVEVNAVLTCITIDLQPWEAAALVDFTHNVGAAALCSSTLARMANAGAEPFVWCHQMLRWTHATKLGVVVELPGLVKRRQFEYQMCIGNAPAPMAPQEPHS